MKFADAAKSRSASRFGERCHTCEFLRNLDKKLRAEVDEAMAAPVMVVNAYAIYDELAARGFTPPTRTSIQRHRRNCVVR